MKTIASPGGPKCNCSPTGPQSTLKAPQRHPKFTSKSPREYIVEPMVAKEAPMEPKGTPRDPKGIPKDYQRHPKKHFESVLGHLKPLIPLERGMQILKIMAWGFHDPLEVLLGVL